MNDIPTNHLRCCDGCGKPPRFDSTSSKLIPLKKCSRCQQSLYHDADCQRSHFKIHRLKCRKIENIVRCNGKSSDVNNSHSCSKYKFKVTKRREDEELGLYIVPDTDPNGMKLPIRNNKLLFPPLCPPVLYKPCRTTHCVYCMKLLNLNNIDDVVVICNNPRYTVLLCSHECYEQTKDWLPAETDLIVSMLNTNNDMIVLPMILVLYRFALKLSIRDEILSLQSHDLSTTKATEGQVIHQYLVINTVRYMLLNTQLPGIHMPDNVKHLQVEHLTKILNGIKVNAFTISSDDVVSLGIALFHGPSYRINHSCDPNARQTYITGEKGQLPQLLVEFIKPIQIGDEVCISYIDKEDTFLSRRQQLQQLYNFYCKCSRCLVEETYI